MSYVTQQKQTVINHVQVTVPLNKAATLESLIAAALAMPSYQFPRNMQAVSLTNNDTGNPIYLNVDPLVSSTYYSSLINPAQTWEDLIGNNWAKSIYVIAGTAAILATVIVSQ